MRQQCGFLRSGNVGREGRAWKEILSLRYYIRPPLDRAILNVTFKLGHYPLSVDVVGETVKLGPVPFRLFHAHVKRLVARSKPNS